MRLRDALAERGLPPRHAQDLLTAFRMDVTKLRYTDWDDLIHYCSYSAMPVGRFVLDVHGESRATWPANDALCAALQINNHLQDCGKDFRELNRVYIPLDAFAAAGAAPEELGARPRLAEAAALHPRSRGAHRRACWREGEPFSGQIENTRLALEVAVIHTYARRIVALLQARDPLSERVHLSKAQFALYGLSALSSINSLRRIGRAAACAQAARCAAQACVSESRGRRRNPRYRRPARLRQLVLHGDAHHAARAARGDVRDLFVLPQGRRHRGRRRARATGALEQLRAVARRHRRALQRAARSRARAASRRRSRPSASSARISRP